MEIDPVCGMNVDEKKAREKNLFGVKEGRKYYFCSKSCKDKFLDGEKWYRSEKFGKIFPWVLGAVLIGGAIWSISGDFMLKYMGVFFIVFSLMKMLDVKGFADAFSMYDLIAKRSRSYALIYPFIELALGILYLTETWIIGAAWVTLIIMFIGAIGVGRNLLSKNKIQCACLGTKIGVPLTKVTFLEDLIMVGMAVRILF
jgi:YHS domain-containing protein